MPGRIRPDAHPRNGPSDVANGAPINAGEGPGTRRTACYGGSPFDRDMGKFA
ncbi:hypothetical protein GCM10020366_49010 [Saccharopolyspora gregorii]|uniref:Uncharacterized protein n=1 Tax=Saccharopolyspora gregorii TaxID=33914 RepID=A0ABP6RWR8_9PSEU